jgi:hypothetical protein
MASCATLSLNDFTQTDPLAADVGSPYPSAYVYGNNNPLRFVDPSGRRGELAFSSGDRSLIVPDSPTPSAASVSFGRGDAWYHNRARDSILLAMQGAAVADPTVDFAARELAIPTGSKNNTGRTGFVDLAVKRKNGDYELAEVKPSDPSYVVSGSIEVAVYALTLQTALVATNVSGNVGVATMTSPWPQAGSVTTPCQGGQCLVSWVHTAPAVYQYTVTQVKQPPPMPVPVTVPVLVPQKDPKSKPFRIPWPGLPRVD